MLIIAGLKIEQAFHHPENIGSVIPFQRRKQLKRKNSFNRYF
jgi:hypothetical protein